MENIILEWINNDHKISELLSSIERRTSTPADAAKEIFHTLPGLLQIPKMPDDITEEHYEEHNELDLEAVCVFEELGIINFLEPESDIKDRVLKAIYNVFHKKYIDREEVMRQVLPDQGYEGYVYFFGDDIDVFIRISKEANPDYWK